MHRYFDIGRYFHIAAYNLFIGIGIALAMLLLQYNKTFQRLSSRVQDKIHLGLMFTVILGFLGAYLFDTLTQGQVLFNSLNYGLTLLGGVVTGMLFMLFFLKANKIEVLPTFNLLTPYFALAHFFGRIGCFFAGCCFGKATTSSLGVVFPINSIPYQHYHALVKIHPTQLYEAAFALIMFCILTLKKVNNAFFVYFMLYVPFRYFVEYLREDDRGTLLGQQVLSPSQLVSLILFVSCGLYLLVQYRSNRHSRQMVIGKQE